MVDLGGQFPALLVLGQSWVGVYVWDGERLVAAGTMEQGHTVYDPAERALSKSETVCRTQCGKEQTPILAIHHVIERLRDGKLVQIKSEMLPAK